MFDITTNQVIKIHKGDSSGVFPLFLNMGTRYQPIQYKFFPKISIFESPDQLEIDLDSKIFSKKLQDDGFYDFEYNYLYDEKGERTGELGWYLDGEFVLMSQYGFTITGTPNLQDHIITALLDKNASEVYFYILDLHSDLDDWIVKKTFISSGEILTEFKDARIGTLDEIKEVVDENNNILLSFTPEDTQCLKAGEYCYQIRAKLYDIQNDECVFNTVTNRLPFYVIDGEDSVIW